MTPPLPLLSPRRIAGIYLVIGALWIAFSDRLLLLILPDPLDQNELMLAQTFKGWLFIVVSAGLLWLLIHRLSERQNQIISALDFNNRIIENTHNGVLITNADDEIIYANHAMEKITGYSREDMLGQNPSMLSSGLHDQSFYRDMWEQLEREHVWQGEITNRHKNGSLFTEWITISKLHDADTGQIRYVAVVSDISESKADRDRLQYLAFYDPLTELPNRSLMQEHLKKILHQANLEHHLIAIMFVDLDDFKVINETLGHKVGDRVLKEVAQRFTAALPDAYLGRFSGDQFIVLLSAITQLDQAARGAEQLLESLEEPLTLDGDHAITIRTTLGITLTEGIRAASDKDTAALFSEADAALNECKSRDKNSFAFYRSDMTERAEKRLMLEQALSQAIHNDELRLYYQPVFDMATGHLAGAEALVRWEHPEEGLISPGDFIPIAEDTGLILPLGDWVMRETIRQTRHWLNEGLDPGVVAFNVAARQMAQEHFPQTLRQALKEGGLSAEHVEVELTESGLMALGNGTIEKLHAIRATGVQLAVDDFGTGYSSLAYLRRFPLNKLKIDRSFVFDLQRNQENEPIIRAILAMAHALDLSVQAEGVETQEQLTLLSELNCDTWQGFLVSGPVPAEAFEASWLRAAEHQSNSDAAGRGPA